MIIQNNNSKSSHLMVVVIMNAEIKKYCNNAVSPPLSKIFGQGLTSASICYIIGAAHDQRVVLLLLNMNKWKEDVISSYLELDLKFDILFWSI